MPLTLRIILFIEPACSTASNVEGEGDATRVFILSEELGRVINSVRSEKFDRKLDIDGRASESSILGDKAAER